MGKMPLWFPIALAGGFGGTAPNVFRVGTTLTRGGDLPEMTYIIGVFIFFVMGACIVLAFKETEAKKAFFLGLSLPAMFQSGASDIAEQTSMIFQPVAYAHEEPARKVAIYYNTDAPEFSFIFSAAEKRGREEVLLQERGTEGQVDDGLDYIYIPAWATSFTVLVLEDRQQSKSSPILLDRNWEIEIVPQPFRGFKQAVGLDGTKWDILISTKQRK